MDMLDYVTPEMPNGIDFTVHNKGVTPIFYIESYPDEAATALEGRAVYRDIECVRIQIAGDLDSAATHPVDNYIKARFAAQYDRWKKTQQTGEITGTPLAKWPMMTPGLIKELASLNIFSVEELAGVSDTNISRIFDGRVKRAQAAAWLVTAKDSAETMRYAAEAERLREQMAAMQEQIDRLSVLPDPTDKNRARKQPAEAAA